MLQPLADIDAAVRWRGRTAAEHLAALPAGQPIERVERGSLATPGLYAVELVDVDDPHRRTARFGFDGHGDGGRNFRRGLGHQFLAPHARFADDAENPVDLVGIDADEQRRVAPEQKATGTGQFGDAEFFFDQASIKTVASSSSTTARMSFKEAAPFTSASSCHHMACA